MCSGPQRWQRKNIAKRQGLFMKWTHLPDRLGYHRPCALSLPAATRPVTRPSGAVEHLLQTRNPSPMQGFSTTLLKRTLLAAAVMSSLMLSSGLASAAESPGKLLSEKYGLPWPAAIAHRGASFDAPEETIPAYTLARDLGADYLEMDIQRTKDGVLIALHDDVLERTTNIAQVFPTRVKDPVSSFTLAELKQLDAGSWFNKAYPDRARDSYAGLQILTLDEVIDIAEGGANKPGLYIETKVPNKIPGV
ncbi:Glycerophosphoryl diester phosphodiesterase [Pseudomonas cannabina]|uniref:Glycerophosphoryl diester phosphodiesterase n=2 Tax=Pseudomonas cannabina TaxID=86840 RepID=A0A3M3RCC7_PSECA|nr:Glycerophosphoryl diester phosphodiesterase [Pseudomonas cannabina]